MIPRRSLVASAAALVGSPLAAPALAQPRPSVRMALDWVLEGQQSPFILGADQGHFANAGVDIRVDRGFGSGDTVTKIAAGTYDIGFADLGAVIAFNARQGGEPKVISVFQVYDLAPMTILTLADSGIAAPRDLPGKTLAAPAGDSSRLMFPVLAQANGIDPGAVNWIDVTAQLREVLLVQKHVQAISAQITSLLSFRPLGAEGNIRVLRYGDHGVDLYGHAIITTPAYAAANPEAVRRVLLGVASAWRAAIANPAASAQALRTRDGLADPALEAERLGLILDAAVVTPGVRQRGLSEVDPARLSRTVKAVAQAFKLPELDPAALYRPDFLPPASARTVA